MLREAQAPVTSALKPLGFRKFGNNYNRPAADGLIQVVNFQSGQYVSIFHGSFTVNLGVYIPCVALSEGNSTPGRAVAEFRCHIRQRLNALSGVGEDEWWPLDQRARWTGMRIARVWPALRVTGYARRLMTRSGALPSTGKRADRASW
jgi:hypothetical protein